jgi:methyltransferase (TIGR00027 family)
VYGVTADPFAGAGITALGLAAARSVESGMPDRLIEDPFARVLFEAAERELPMRVEWPARSDGISDTEALHLHGSRYIGLRTRFYDDFLRAALDAGLTQAVLLGSGLDTRAFRLDLSPDVRLFELDRPEVLAFKGEALSSTGAGPTCKHTAVACDLGDDWAASLLSAGFDRTDPSVWIAEGVLAYLDELAQGSLLRTASDLAASGSHLAADHIVGDLRRGGRTDELTRRSGLDMTALLASGDSNIERLLESLGWQVDPQSTAETATRYGRDLADPFDMREAPEPPWLDTTFLTATLHY